MMIRRKFQSGRCAALIFGAALAGIAATPALPQVQETDLVVRIEQLERQLRQITGIVEELQYRNQQLEQQLRRPQDDPGARAAPPAAAVAPPPLPSASAAPPAVPPAGTRRRDVFDPAENPNAPGAPRPLGVPGWRSDAAEPRYDSPPGGGAIIADEPAIGAPGGREPGTPLDLSTLAGRVAADSAPGGAARVPAAVANAAPTLPPRQTPRGEFDLAYGYLLRKDYALAEQGLRAFTEKYPSDPLVADARFWLAESQFQRQDYRQAAEGFVFMSKKYDKHPKAADALVRLGQSLAALKEKELACATFVEVTRKYPQAPAGLKQLVEREQKRVRC
jgi:tol-pal system protein YbgF